METLTKTDKLKIIEKAIQNVQELMNKKSIFLCNYTNITAIPEIAKWIEDYQNNYHYAFHHNPFTGKRIEVFYPDNEYSKEKLIILFELKKRIENDEPLTIHENCFKKIKIKKFFH